MPLLAAEQAAIEQTLAQALRDVSRANIFRLKAGLRILMTTNIPTFEAVCSLGVQRDLQDFKELLLNPETIAPQSTQQATDKALTLNFIKQYTLNHLYLLDNRTAILPNTYLVKKAIMEGEHLKSVVHSSALKNVLDHAHYNAWLEKKFKEEGIPAEQIALQVKKALQSTQALHQAVLAGNVSAILQSLATHGVDVNFANEQGMTPLHLATQAGLTETVKLLLTVPNIQVNLVSNNGWTPLHLAARLGFADIADALLTIPTLEINRVNSEGWGALHWAAWHGATEVVTVLLMASGILVNLADRNGTTPLHLAARNGHADIIRILHASLKLNVNPQDNDQRTPLQIAVMYQHEAAVKTLLALPGVLINAVDTDGATALHWAARNGHIGILKALLAHPNIECAATDHNGMMPFDWAKKNHHLDALKLLPTNLQPKRRLFFDRLIKLFKKKSTA